MKKNFYGQLLRPYQIGKMKLKNRLCMAPMDYYFFEGDENESRMTQRLVKTFEARARGGCGLIFTSCVQAEREIMPYPRALMFSAIDTDDRIKEFAAVADAVHAYGAKMGCELTMGSGRYYDIPAEGKPPIAPSECQTQYTPEIRARAMTQEEINHMITTFAQGVGRLKKAGFDAVLIMGGGGYLINQFLSPAWNKRTDKYGGSVEKRTTFLLETVEAIKKEVGNDYPIIISLNMDDLLPEGVSDHKGLVIDEVIQIAQILEAHDYVDAFAMRIGNYYNQEYIIPSTYMDNHLYRENIAKFKAAVTKPVIYENKVQDPSEMQRLLENNICDMVSMGRGWIADPDWAIKTVNGENVRPCLRCNMCLDSLWSAKRCACAVNPSHGFEFEGPITTAVKKKKVVVVGGGPAGCTAALTAAQRGHDVTLIEKDGEVGGKIQLICKPDYKAHEIAYKNYLKRAIDESDVKLIVNKAADVTYVESLNPDVVFVAIGAVPFIPPIEGVENVMLADDVLNGRKKPKGTVSVIGGGMVGCEIAYCLAKQGHAVNIIEMQERILMDASFVTVESQLAKLELPEITIYDHTTVCGVTASSVNVKNEKGDKKILASDTVILAVGYVGTSDFYNALNEDVREVYQIGDNRRARKILNATHEAYRIARSL